MSEVKQKTGFLDSSESEMIEENCNMVDEQPDWHQEVVVREKRLRSSSEEILDEDGFTTVRSKRAAKMSKNTSSVLSLVRNEDDHLPAPEEKIVVSITGNEVLPKQFKMARLLRSEGILNISSIIYKNPFKIIIEFKNQESAQKLMDCTKITDMGLRCQMLNEMNVSYGIIRDVDLDIQDDEIKDNLESDFEIVSLRRLKRTTSTGKWVECETIRIGFKGSVLPTYVLGYGCRFKVDPYMYPVTQCTGCWKFGHSIRFCPSRKIICPKCTEYHANCEISIYKCVNCKGNHMAIDKLCPVFLKEKNIRIIMRDLNYPYKKALTIYLNENKSKKTDNQTRENSTRAEPTVENIKIGRSYKDVLIDQPEMHSRMEDSSDEEKHLRTELPGTKQRVRRNRKSKKRNKSNPKTESNDNIVTEESDTGMSIEERDDEHKDSEKKKKGSNLNIMKFVQKFKEIYLSDSSLDDKIKIFFSFVFEEIMKYISVLLRDNDICAWLLSKFNYG